MLTTLEKSRSNTSSPSSATIRTFSGTTTLHSALVPFPGPSAPASTAVRSCRTRAYCKISSFEPVQTLFSTSPVGVERNGAREDGDKDEDGVKDELMGRRIGRGRV